MTSILLVGAGGHCLSCIDVIESDGQYSIGGIIDRELSLPNSSLIYPIIGVDDDLRDLRKRYSYASVTVGQVKSADIRKKLYEELVRLEYILPSICSPYAYLSKRATCGEGTIIFHGVVVNSGAMIGSNCIINSQSLIEHGATIGDHCHISTGAKVNGNVIVGSQVFIGSGSIIHQGISIGDNAIVAAGSIIREDIPPGTLLRG